MLPGYPTSKTRQAVLRDAIESCVGRATWNSMNFTVAGRNPESPVLFTTVIFHSSNAGLMLDKRLRTGANFDLLKLWNSDCPTKYQRISLAVWLWSKARTRTLCIILIRRVTEIWRELCTHLRTVGPLWDWEQFKTKWKSNGNTTSRRPHVGY